MRAPCGSALPGGGRRPPRGDGVGGRARGRSAREQLAATCSGGRSVAGTPAARGQAKKASLDGARGGRREAGTSTGPPATYRGPARRIRDQEETGARWTAKRVGGVEESRRRGVRGRSGAGARGAWERKVPGQDWCRCGRFATGFVSRR